MGLQPTNGDENVPSHREFSFPSRDGEGAVLARSAMFFSGAVPTWSATLESICPNRNIPGQFVA
jgi:hypothetical protein